MDAIWQWGLELIRAVQQIQGPLFDGLFKGITFLGEEDFFLILLPLVFWCVDFAVGARLAFAFFLSAYLNSGLKDLFAHPRPFELDPTVKRHEVGGYGLPSGHSQSAVVVWGMLASAFRKKWLWIVAIALMVLIGFSRIYLGVHFPTDVLGGWAIGVVILLCAVALGPRIEAWLKRAGLAVQLILAVVAPLALLLIHTTDDTLSVLGVMLGAGVGVALVGRVAPFSAGGPFWQRAVRLLIGIIVLIGLRYGLKALFPGEGEPLYFALRFVRYAVLGLWTGLGAPWLFLKLRLASNP